MVSEEFLISNPSGLHLRPAGILSREAMKFRAHISINANGTTANAKSVLSVLGASVKPGDTIELVCDGEDEQFAMTSLKRLIDDGLGE